MTVWEHVRKGPIAGKVEWSDGTWTHIRLTADCWGDARHRQRAFAGDILRCRTEFLTVIVK